ncbi:MAG: response regulator transcription factor [Bacteroidetes bacterium]|nr:response regulator transcription factor [Bacteroidota bacterium]
MNCIIIDDHELSRKALEHFIEKAGFLNLIHSFSNPISALSFILNNKEIDLIFLDIEMPEMNGMEFINTAKQHLPQIILTTHHKEFALDAFEHNVTDYIMKPITYPRFFQAVSKARNIFEKQATYHISNDTVFVKSGTSILKLKKADIVYVEALVDYVVLHTAKEKFIIHSSMNAMENKLSPKEYMRVHRSYIVRIDAIDSIEDNAISYNEKLIPIGKTYREEVLKRLNMF